MNWDDDLLLANTPKERGVIQLAVYAVHLSKGSALTARSIKVKTIKEYVFAAASLLASFSGIDHRYDNPTDRQFGSLLQAVYNDLEKYETVPERREPYTPAMHQEAERIAASYRAKDNRSLIP